MPIDSQKEFKPINISVLTVSDTRTEATDKSGQILANKIKEKGHSLKHKEIVIDDKEKIKSKIQEWCNIKDVDVIIATGGTGLTGRDTTPEALDEIKDKEIPGFGELMRSISLKYVPTAILSRQVGVIRGNSLIINLPGQPKAIRETIDEIFSAIPYCIDLIGGPYIETKKEVLEVFRPKNAKR